MAVQKGDGRRVLRFEKEVRQELGSYMLTGFKIPLPGWVAIERVIASKDLKTAKVYVSVMGTDSEKKEAIQIINDHRHQIQSSVGRTLQLRFIPKLTFYLDEVAEKVLEIERILHDLGQKRPQE